MKTARFASFSLGMGMAIAATSAFADPIPQTNHQYPGQYGGHVHDETCHHEHEHEQEDVRTYYPQQGERRANGWLERYDVNNDYSVSFGEYRRFEIVACEQAFERFDANNDGILTERERAANRWSECDAMEAEISNPRPYGRWGWGRASFRRNYMRRGVTKQQFRYVASQLIERDFRQADLDRSGVLSKYEIVAFKHAENEALGEGRVFDRRRYGRGV